MRTAAWAGPIVLGFGVVAAVANPTPPGTPPAPAPALPPEPPPPPELARVATEELIRRLASDDYKVREAAGRELSRRAEKALPELKAALATTTDPEAARRLQVLTRKLEQDRLVAAKRVTLKLTDKPVKEALDEITRQTGYKIQHGGDSGSKFTFDIADKPFWEAIDQVAAAAGLNVYPDHDEDSGIRAYNQDSYNPHVSYAGPFRFLATNINTNKNVQLSGLSRRGGQPRQPEYVNLNFQIQAEPKNPLLGTVATELTEATDEFGGSLLPARNDPNAPIRSQYFNGGYRGFNVYANVALARPNRASTTLKTLKGKVTVLMLAGTRPELTIPNILKVKAEKFAGRTAELEIDSASENNGTVTVTCTVRKLGGDGREDWSWAGNVWQKLEVQDDKGNKYRCYGPNSQNNTGNSVSLVMNFGTNDNNGQKLKLGPPAKLVFNEWLTAANEVAFEFKDIPLP